MSQLSMCRTFGVLERRGSTKDSSGGQAGGAWAAQVDGFACDVQPANSRTIDRYAQKVIEVTHTAFVSEDIQAIFGDRITVTDAGGNARYFLVQGWRFGAPGYDQWPGVADVLEIPQPPQA